MSVEEPNSDKPGTEISRRRAALGGAAIAAGALAAPNISSLGTAPAFAQLMSNGLFVRPDCNVTSKFCITVDTIDAMLIDPLTGSAPEIRFFSGCITDTNPGADPAPQVAAATLTGTSLATGAVLTVTNTPLAPDLQGFEDCAITGVFLDAGDPANVTSTPPLPGETGTPVPTTGPFNITATGDGPFTFCVEVTCTT